MSKKVGTGTLSFYTVNDGIDGVDGQNSYTWIKYADTPTSGISDTPEGKTYLGISYNQSTETPSNNYEDYSWSLIKGQDGVNGTDGVDGIPGPPGADGQTTYTWIKYADDAQGNGISNSPDGKAYMGLAVNKIVQQESDDPSEYNWVKVLGDEGPQGLPGVDGVDGVSTYTWIRYADDEEGSNMSNFPDGKDYMGIAYNKPTPIESQDPLDYTWTLFKGSDGVDGVDGVDGTTYYTWIKYADTPTTGMSDDPTGKTYMGIAYNKTEKTESSDYSDYSWSLIKGEDGEDGVDGTDGIDGKDGRDGIDGENALVAFLSNESHTLTANSSGVVSDFSGADTQITVLNGTRDDTSTWVISAAPSPGVFGTLSGRSYRITGMTVDTGYVDITASKDGFPSITKKFALAKSKSGENGSDGSDAPLLRLNANSQIFKKTPGSTTTTPATISVTGIVQNTSITEWSYSTNGGASFSTALPAGVTRVGNTVTMTGAATTALSIVVKITNGTVSDTMTIVKVEDGVNGTDGKDGVNGVNGTNGKDGVDGKNAVIAILSNEAHTLPANSTGAVSSFTGANTSITVLNGTVDDTSNWTISAAPSSGITGSLNGKVYTVIGMSVDTGYVEITASRSGFTSLVKRFVLTKSKSGANGTNGTNAPLLKLSSSAQVFKKSTSSTTTTPTTITVTGVAENTSITAWSYSTNGGTSFSTTAPTGVVRSGNTVTITGASLGVASVVLKISNGTISDTLTVVKVEDGVNGTNGTNGTNGVGVSDITMEFYLSTSKTTQSGGSWLETKPAWESGKYLWLRNKTTYTNGTIDYTTPYVDSSWEVFDERFAIGGGPPSNPKLNQMWLDTSIVPNALNHWDGEGWVSTEYFPEGEVTVSESEPTEKRDKMLWLSTSNNTLLRWDASESEWVPAEGDVDNFITAVAQSQVIQNMFNEKANATELVLYEQKVDLEAKFEAEREARDQVVGELDNRIQANAREVGGIAATISALPGEVIAKFSSNASGINLIRNSIGWANGYTFQGSTGSVVKTKVIDFWSYGTTVPTGSGLATQAEFNNMESNEIDGHGSAWTSKNGSVVGRVFQEVSGLVIGKQYTISALFKRASGVATNDRAVLRLYRKNVAAGNFTQIGSDMGLKTEISNDFMFAKQTFTASETVVYVQLDISNSIEQLCEITGLMMNEGESPYGWTKHVEEIYATGVHFNINGIRVQSGQNYTQMTSNDFSGYVLGDNDEARRIFSLNGDTTEVANLEASESIRMGGIRIDRSGSNWVFKRNG